MSKYMTLRLALQYALKYVHLMNYRFLFWCGSCRLDVHERDGKSMNRASLKNGIKLH